MSGPLERFGLTLMVNDACNLRCTSCYTGRKFSAPMAREIGMRAIERAFRTLTKHARLDLSFFGGEPLLESARILDWIAYAQAYAHSSEKRVRFNLTTNGTITHRDAWQIMMAEEVDVAVSFDRDAKIHERHPSDPPRSRRFLPGVQTL